VLGEVAAVAAAAAAIVQAMVRGQQTRDHVARELRLGKSTISGRRGSSLHAERAEESNQEHEGSNFKQEEQKKGNDRFHNRASERIIACPSCKQKIRFKVPLNRDIGKCKKCSSRFELHMDESGHIHITKLDEKEKYHDSENEIKNIENCFEIHEINQNSTPTEIKSAYRKKMMEYLPDKVEKLGSKLNIIAEEESKKFNTAYSTLKENGYL
jgi:hypothetical protein